MSSSKLTEHDSFFSLLKRASYDQFDASGDGSGYFNRIDITFSIKIATTDLDSHGDNEPWVAGATYPRYFTVYATNVVQFPDGTIGWGGADPQSLQFANYVDSVSMDDLVNVNFTQKKADYNVTPITTVIGKL